MPFFYSLGNLTKNPTIDQHEATADNALLSIVAHWFFGFNQWHIPLEEYNNDSNEEIDDKTFTVDHFQVDEAE